MSMPIFEKFELVLLGKSGAWGNRFMKKTGKKSRDTVLSFKLQAKMSLPQ
jgi:hypothetical protein